MGIHWQAMAGKWGFLTLEEIPNDSKNKKIMYTLKSSVSWKVSSEKQGREYLYF
jgi:hypothetical protein